MISQFALIQLITFLDRQPLNKFPTIQAFNRINKTIAELKYNLGEYYTKYEELETKKLSLATPYIQKANDLRATLKDKKLDAALLDLQKQADADQDLTNSGKALNDFKIAEDATLTEAEITDKQAVKELFDAQALTWDGWLNKAVVAELSSFLE